MLKTSSTLVSVLPALALSLLSLLQPSTAVAGTIFFNDVSFPFVTTNVPARVSGGCATVLDTNVCTITLLPMSISAGWQSEDIREMAPGDPNTVSDTLAVNPNFDSGNRILSFTLVFTSGDNLTSVAPNNFIHEDGTVQIATSITWVLPGTDTVIGTDVLEFQSTESPEPSTALLMLAGLGLSGISVIRRRRASSTRMTGTGGDHRTD
jgi:PEP-CTERM motif